MSRTTPMDGEQAAKVALALPESAEQDHHGRPSFRVGGRIFTTLPDGEHLNVMVDELAANAAVATHPEACEELWWGRRRRGVRVTLDAATPVLLEDLLHDAWQRKAPAQLVRVEAG